MGPPITGPHTVLSVMKCPRLLLSRKVDKVLYVLCVAPRGVAPHRGEQHGQACASSHVSTVSTLTDPSHPDPYDDALLVTIKGEDYGVRDDQAIPFGYDKPSSPSGHKAHPTLRDLQTLVLPRYCGHI